MYSMKVLNRLSMRDISMAIQSGSAQEGLGELQSFNRTVSAKATSRCAVKSTKRR